MWLKLREVVKLAWFDERIGFTTEYGKRSAAVAQEQEYTL